MDSTFSFGLFDIVFALVVIAAIVAGAFAYGLHRKGTPKDQLAGQTLLKAADLGDSIRDQVLATMKEWGAKLPDAGLKDAYFDADNLLLDLGRLPPTFADAVRLDGALKRDGAGPGIDYWTHPNGNVTRTKP